MEAAMPFTLTSPAFAEGEAIPRKYARDRDNLSPPLKWAGAPAKTRSFALVVEDPDAPHGTFHHWAVYNIDAAADRLGESVETGPDKHAYARNDFGVARYDGPEPPPGDPPHHYCFRLYALDVPSLAVARSAGAAELKHEAEKHALARAELTGTYQR
jgi:Raf kinase inhibitor-like YbhB/YbcL family protein